MVSDIPLAVTTLGEACELHSNVFGETAAEMGEVYFYYGKALLEMARLESGVLGNALDGGESQMQVLLSGLSFPVTMTTVFTVHLETCTCCGLLLLIS